MKKNRLFYVLLLCCLLWWPLTILFATFNNDFRSYYFSGWAGRASVFFVAHIGSNLYGESAYDVMADCYLALQDKLNDDSDDRIIMSRSQMKLFEKSRASFLTINDATNCEDFNLINDRYFLILKK